MQYNKDSGKKATPGFKTYSGTPTDVLDQISSELGDILANAKFPCTPLHALAVFKVAVSACVGATEDGEKGPSLGMMLQLLTHRFTKSEWTLEECKAFDKEFVEIIKAMADTKDSPLLQAHSSTLGNLTKDKELGFLSPQTSE